MTYDTENIFAKILREEIPCDKIYEDDYVLAFKDIHPQLKIHVLVIPKGAYISLEDFGANGTAEEITAFYRAVAQIAKEQGLLENGFRAIANTGEYGRQDVPHYHLHLLGGEPVGPFISKD